MSIQLSVEERFSIFQIKKIFPDGRAANWKNLIFPNGIWSYAVDHAHHEYRIYNVCKCFTVKGVSPPFLCQSNIEQVELDGIVPSGIEWRHR